MLLVMLLESTTRVVVLPVSSLSGVFTSIIINFWYSSFFYFRVTGQYDIFLSIENTVMLRSSTLLSLLLTFKSVCIIDF